MFVNMRFIDAKFDRRIEYKRYNIAPILFNKYFSKLKL